MSRDATRRIAARPPTSSRVDVYAMASSRSGDGGRRDPSRVEDFIGCPYTKPADPDETGRRRDGGTEGRTSRSRRMSPTGHATQVPGTRGRRRLSGIRCGAVQHARPSRDAVDRGVSLPLVAPPPAPPEPLITYDEKSVHVTWRGRCAGGGRGARYRYSVYDADAARRRLTRSRSKIGRSPISGVEWGRNGATKCAPSISIEGARVESEPVAELA